MFGSFLPSAWSSTKAYSGRGSRHCYAIKAISAAHAQARLQGLSDGHFSAFLKHFREALNEVGVRGDKMEKVMKLLEGKRSTVLGSCE